MGGTIRGITGIGPGSRSRRPLGSFKVKVLFGVAHHQHLASSSALSPSSMSAPSAIWGPSFAATMSSSASTISQPEWGALLKLLEPSPDTVEYHHLRLLAGHKVPYRSAALWLGPDFIYLGDDTHATDAHGDEETDGAWPPFGVVRRNRRHEELWKQARRAHQVRKRNKMRLGYLSPLL